ncbi:MAG: hypothetical protein PHE89_07630 [Alphaproteobacteria bacterium]|nr:hypothetical protein [Alphaproteobacteria bacterium]
MKEFITTYTFEIIASGVLALALFLLWLSNRQIRRLQSKLLHPEEKSPSKKGGFVKATMDSFKYRNVALLLNLETGKFCDASGEPIEALSFVVAEMDAHWKFVYDFKGLMPVRIKGIYNRKDSPYHSATVSLVDYDDICEVISLKDCPNYENTHGIGTRDVVELISSNEIVFRCPNNKKYKLGDVLNVYYKVEQIDYEGHVLNRLTLKLRA